MEIDIWTNTSSLIQGKMQHKFLMLGIKKFDPSIRDYLCIRICFIILLDYESIFYAKRSLVLNL